MIAVMCEHCAASAARLKNITQLPGPSKSLSWKVKSFPRILWESTSFGSHWQVLGQSLVTAAHSALVQYHTMATKQILSKSEPLLPKDLGDIG